MVLANTNPCFYRSNDNGRELIYCTMDNLIVGGVGGSSERIESIDRVTAVTIHARRLMLAGTITCRGGDVQIYCRTLVVDATSKTTIDVSPVLPDEYLDRDGKQKVGEGGSAGASGYECNQIKHKRYGDAGEDAGSITIVCDEIQIDGSLTLNARGGDGFPGHDGQPGADGADGKEGTVVWEGYKQRGRKGPQWRKKTKVHATAGELGKPGGNALAGGQGGSGGAVRFRYRSGTGESNVHICVDPGRPGPAGKPGTGGRQGIGGKIFLEAMITGVRELVGQQPPTDTADRPYASDGKSAFEGGQGARGRTHLPWRADELRTLATMADALFFSMMLQAARFRYLSCNPERFIGDITYGKGSKTEWEKIGRELEWLTMVLGPYVEIAADDLESMRKNAILQLATTLWLRHGSNQTYYNHSAAWVPRATFAALRGEVADRAKSAGLMEQQFFALAQNYEDRNHERLDRVEQLEALRESAAVNEHVYRAMVSKVLECRHQIEDSDVDFDLAKRSLKDRSVELEAAISARFHCSFEAFVRASEMMVFTGGNPAMAVTQIAGLVDTAATKIETSDGFSVDKKHKIDQIRQLRSEDLVQGFRDAGMNPDGTLPTGDDEMAKFTANLDKLDEIVGQLTGVIKTSEAQTAIKVYRAALVARADALVAYNAAILVAAQHYDAWQTDKAELATLEKSPQPLNAYDLQVFSHYAHRYQAQLERLLEVFYRAERKHAFLTLGRRWVLDELWNSWIGLWSREQPGNHRVEDFVVALQNMESELSAHYGTLPGSATAFPDESDHAVRLSAIHARLPEGLVRALREKGKVSFELIPRARVAPSPSAVMVHNADDLFDVRISCIRPHVVGARTKHGNVRIRIQQDKRSRLQDEHGNLFEFAHDPVPAVFVHAASFIPPVGDAIYTPIRTGESGKLCDSTLDMVALYGKWEINLLEEADDPETINAGLDRSGISDVFVYFKGFYRPLPLQPAR